MCIYVHTYTQVFIIATSGSALSFQDRTYLSNHWCEIQYNKTSDRHVRVTAIVLYLAVCVCVCVFSLRLQIRANVPECGLALI